MRRAMPSGVPPSTAETSDKVGRKKRKDGATTQLRRPLTATSKQRHPNLTNINVPRRLSSAWAIR